MTIPNFLIIGAAKAGTTSLYNWLNQHPQIYMTPIKETNFFAFEGEDISYPQGTISESYLAGFKTSYDSYIEQFQGVSTEIAIGDASPSYLYHSNASKRIQSYLPNVKIIAILRDPVDRAYSQFLHHILADFENCSDFSEALKEEKNRINNHWWWGFFYTEGGFYYTQLTRYFDLFDPAQIRIFLYEDLINNRPEFLRNIFNFLNVDETFIPETSIQYNTTGIPKNRLLHELLSKPNLIANSFKNLFPQNFRRRIAINLTNANLVKPNLSQDIRNQLIEVYRNDILSLQELINRDLTHWLI